MFDDCRDRFNIYEMDILILFSVCQRKGQEHNSQVQSMCDTKGTLNIKK